MTDQNNRSDEPAKTGAEDIEVKKNVEPGSEEDIQKQQQAELSRQAQSMGEGRKRAAESLVVLAETSPEAKAQLLKLIEDPSEKDYFEKKFGDKFTALLKAEESAKPQESQDAEAAVKTLLKDREFTRTSDLTAVKEKLGLTTEKASQFDDLVKALEGKEIGGQEISFHQAMEMAARQLAPDSPLPSAILRGDVQERPEDKKDEVDVKISDDMIRQNARFTQAKSKEDYAEIVKSVSEKGVFTPAL